MSQATYLARLHGPEDMLEPRKEDNAEPFDYDADETDLSSDQHEYEME